MRGRPQKPWTAHRVRDMLLNLPNRAISVRRLQARVNYKRYPDRWAALLVDMISARGFEGRGDMFDMAAQIDGVKSIRLLDRGY